MNRRPAVFFDRDNTLVANDGYLGDPAGVVLIDGAAQLVARVRALGFATVIFSNQSGVARGMFDEQAVHAVNARFDELLLDADPAAVIDRHEFCPFHPDGTIEAYRQESDLRKPRPGMIYQAAAALGLDVAKSWVVGDAPRDIEAGKVAGCRTILVKDATLKASPAAEAQAVVTPDFVVTSLHEAADVIEREARPTVPVTQPPAPADPEPAPDAEPAAASVTAAAQRPETTDESAAVPPPPATPAQTPLSPPPVRASTGEGSRRAGKTTGRLEELMEEILDELRRREDVRSDFSVSKLIAGVVQVIALATLFMAYLRRDTPALDSTLLAALVFQTLTIALLIMERQR